MIGIMTYLAYLLKERQNILTYWTWLKRTAAKISLTQIYNTQDPLSAVNNISNRARTTGPGLPHRHALPGRSTYCSSNSDNSEDGSQATFQFYPPRLPDIPEYPEPALEAAVRDLPHPHNEDGHTDTEMSEVSSCVMAFTNNCSYYNKGNSLILSLISDQPMMEYGWETCHLCQLG